MLSAAANLKHSGVLFLRSLVDRGLDPAKLALVIRDGAKGCEEAILTVLGMVPQQSCCVHLSRHALDHVDRDNRTPFAKGLRSIFEEPTRPQAQRGFRELCDTWRKQEPQSLSYLAGTIDRSLVWYEAAAPRTIHRSLRSTNPIERFFREWERLCKRRQCAFADKGSVMRIYYAIAAEYCANNPLMAPVKAQRREMNRNLDGGGSRNTTQYKKEDTSCRLTVLTQHS